MNNVRKFNRYQPLAITKTKWSDESEHIKMVVNFFDFSL